MKLPHQTQPIMRNIRTVQGSKGILPQACFDECMADIYGIDECKSAFRSKDPAAIASCLFNFGVNANKLMIGFNIGQCGLECAW